MSLPVFVLASASAARRDLLLSAGLNPIIHPSQFDESLIEMSDPTALVECLASNKAKYVAREYVSSKSGALILGCDSVLWMDGQIYGKPKGADDAIARWQKMRGQTGDLITGHALIDVGKQKTMVQHRMTTVEFAEVSDRQIEAYIATGDPLQCAGCFTLEGKGSSFIEQIQGCHSNVLGLSMPLLREMFTNFGYDLTDFWLVAD